MTKPLVSVIMPTYSRSDFLPRAINSVLNQTYQNIELIVIDDNDPKSEYRKKTEKVMKKYKDNKKVIYLKQNKNQGACVARNRGIFSASGEYITFLDDDDEFLPHNIEKEIKYITKNNYDVIFCNILVINKETGNKKEIKYKKDFNESRESLLRKHLVDIISGGIAFLYKTDVLKKLGGFYEIDANQEYILMLNTINHNFKIGYYDFTGSIGYEHKSDIRITGSKKAADAKKEVIKLVKPYLKEISFSDRNKVMFRLKLFVFYQYLKMKNIKSIFYAIVVLPHVGALKWYLKKKKSISMDHIIYK